MLQINLSLRNTSLWLGFPVDKVPKKVKWVKAFTAMILNNSFECAREAKEQPSFSYISDALFGYFKYTAYSREKT